MKRASLLPVLALTALVLPACGPGPEEPGPQGPRLEEVVIASTEPMAWVARRLLGEAVPVRCLVPAGGDPEFFRPAAEDVARLQRARCVVLNGAEFEQWPDTVNLPTSRVIVSTEGLENRFRRFEKAITHSHGPGGAHSHEGIDGHTWVDPLFLKEQARIVAIGLGRAFPDHQGAIRQAKIALEQDLEATFAEWKELAPRLAEVEVVASHPAYDYLFAGLGLAIRNFDLDPEQILEPEKEAALRSALAAGRSGLLFWESAPSPLVAAHYEKLGLSSVVVTPAEAPEGPSGRDYLQRARANVEAVRAALDALPR